MNFEIYWTIFEHFLFLFSVPLPPVVKALVFLDITDQFSTCPVQSEDDAYFPDPTNYRILGRLINTGILANIFSQDLCQK